MAAPAILSQGTTVSFNAVTVNGVKSISGVGNGTASIIDTTTLADSAKTRRMGLQDFGTLSMNFFWNQDDLGQAEMIAYKASGASASLVITLPATSPSVTANIYTATAYVISMSFDLGVDGIVEGKAELAISGAFAAT